MEHLRKKRSFRTHVFRKYRIYRVEQKCETNSLERPKTDLFRFIEGFILPKTLFW